MLLKSLTYSEHHNDPRHWKVHDIRFERVSLIVSPNATGKTRIMNVLKNVARQITGEKPKLLDGTWDLGFESDDHKEYRFYCHIVDRKVHDERIEVGGEIVLERSVEKGQIRDSMDGKMRRYEPPQDKLTVHVRRDKRQHPFLESLWYWADSYNAFMFSSSAPNQFRSGSLDEQKDRLESLDVVPHLLQRALADGTIAGSIAQDMDAIGYPNEEVGVESMVHPGLPLGTLVVSLKELDLGFNTKQLEMSSGMYRALCMVVIVNYLLQKDGPCTFAVDDMGEGLDFERSSKLIKLILEKAHGSQMQVILTSNDRHLLNAVDVRYWNILERAGGEVTSFNYANSREAFDEFLMTGLNNFDLLRDRMYKGATQG
jgi:hypothetical protein